MTPPLLFLWLPLVASVTLATDIEESINDTSADGVCNNDGGATDMCLACASLAFQVDITFDLCCQNKEAFMFCDACTEDQESCKVVIAETEALKSMYDDYSDDVDDDVIVDADGGNYNMKDLSDIFPDDDSAMGVQKRFGRLFVASPKRFTHYYGKRNGDDDDIEMSKRFGRLFTGPFYRTGGKRFGRLFTGSRFGKRSKIDGSMDKRYGRVYMGGRGRSKLFGKRSGDMEENGGLPEYDKRFGKLFNFGKFGKRDLDSIETDGTSLVELSPMDKRYGSLFVNPRFGKRGGGENDINSDMDLNMDKRYGSLQLNKMGAWGKRFLLGKRYGRLFTGNRKNYFG